MENQKNPKTTTEVINEEINYFKISEDNKIIATQNQDKIFKSRVYGVKTLQSYIQEIEDLRKAPCAKVEEIYTRNGKQINLQDLVSGSGLTSMLALLSKEVKNVVITRRKEVLTGGIIHSIVARYEVELF